MLTNALRSGIPLDVFLSCTIWEVGQMIDAALWRLHHIDQKQALSQAWHTAALAGAAFSGKLPPLKKLLDEPAVKKAQTPQQQLITMHALAALIPGLVYGES